MKKFEEMRCDELDEFLENSTLEEIAKGICNSDDWSACIEALEILWNSANVTFEDIKNSNIKDYEIMDIIQKKLKIDDFELELSDKEWNDEFHSQDENIFRKVYTGLADFDELGPVWENANIELDDLDVANSVNGDVLGEIITAKLGYEIW